MASRGGGPARPDVRLSVLGPLRVSVDGDEVRIPSRRQRALLVLLALNPGRVVPSDRLIEELWDGAPPPQAMVTLRSYVSNLRQALGGRERVGAVLSTRGQGYALDIPADAVDAGRLRTYSEVGRRLLRESRPGDALEAFEAAVNLWSGTPLAEVADHEAVRGLVTQLTETYVAALEGRFEALLDLGRHRDALPDLEAFAMAHPLREQPRALLMLALYRDGRAAEALEVHRSFRALLNDELGIDPSGRLDRLTQQILTQDPALELAAAPGPAEPAGATAGREEVPPNPGSFVGRRRELSLLRARVSAAQAGSGSLLLIGGEPGIGKSTLLDLVEREAHERGVAVHRSRVPGTAGTPAFWLWTQLLDSIALGMDDEALARACSRSAGPVAQLSPTIAERIGQPVPIIGDDAYALRFRLYEAVSAFLFNTAPHAPMLLTIDDLHGADLPSLELLSYIAPSLAGRPVLVVAAYRDLPADRTPDLDATLATVSREDAVYEITLAGLSRNDLAELMNGLVGDTIDGPDGVELVGVLHDRTGGNPFFVRQLTRMISEGAQGPVTLSSLVVPPGVRHVIATRLASAPAASQSVLSAGAILGREFDVRTVAAMVDLTPAAVLDALDGAAHHGLVEPGAEGGTIRRFVHSLVREVVLHQLPAGRSAQLHAAAAAHLAGSATVPPSILAEHFWQARGIVGEAAVPSQLAAAEAAGRVLAYEQSELHLRRTLELIDISGRTQPGVELDILLRLHRLIAATRGWGDPDAQEVVVRATELLEQGALTDETAQSWWGLFFFLIDRGDTARYIDVARSLQRATEGDGRTTAGPAARGAVHLMNIFRALAVDDREGALTELRRARELIASAPAADVAAFDENLHVMLHLIEGYWAALTGDVAWHHSSTQMAIALADADGRPFPRAVSRALSAASAAYLGDVREALEVVAPALDLTRRFGFTWLTTVAESVEAWAVGRDQDPLAAAAVIESTLEALTAANRHGNQSIMSLMAADLYAEGGEVDKARSKLEHALEVPGPYKGMMTGVIRHRLAALKATAPMKK